MAAINGVRERKRSGKVLTPELEHKILDTTLKTRPGDGSTHWSVRMLAGQLGISRTMVHRVWQRHDVQPHRVERFKLSNDPRFAEKVRDIVGLYLNPPDRALVLCIDEKSQIQAFDRTAPLLPLRPVCPSVRRMTTSGTAPPRCAPRCRRPLPALAAWERRFDSRAELARCPKCLSPRDG